MPGTPFAFIAEVNSLLTFSLLLLLPLFATAQLDLKIPKIFSSLTSTFEIHQLKPQYTSCEGIFFRVSDGILTDSNWGKTQEVINTASKQFERRGWSEQFIGDRIQVAWSYRNRSAYIYLKRGVDIIATLGFTWAYYKKTTLPLFDRLAVVSSSRSQLLPGEDSIPTKPFPRPLTSAGNGIILELRTWSIDKSKLSVEDRSKAFAELLQNFLPDIFKVIADFKELYDKPILYTYGDETSVKLYTSMGFEKVDETAIEYENSKWWVLAITPKNLERLVSRIKKPESVAGFNVDVSIQTAYGYVKIKKGGRVTKLADGLMVDNLAEDTEVAPAIFAGEDAQIRWNKYGDLTYISKLALPAKIPGTDMVAAIGSEVTWTWHGEIKISRLQNLTEVSPGIWAAENSRVYVYRNKITRVSKLAYPISLFEYPGLKAATGSEVRWGLTGGSLSLVTKISEAYQFHDGLIAAKDAAIEFDALGVYAISEIAKDYVDSNGRLWKAGQPYKRNF